VICMDGCEFIFHRGGKPVGEFRGVGTVRASQRDWARSPARAARVKQRLRAFVVDAISGVMLRWLVLYRCFISTSEKEDDRWSSGSRARSATRYSTATRSVEFILFWGADKFQVYLRSFLR
jgi:hypothetical protein